MKKCYLDANCLIYFVSDSSSEHTNGIAVIQSIYEKHLIPVISPLCLDEFLYHVKGDIKQKKHDLSSILALPKLQIVNPPIEFRQQTKILEYMKKFGLHPRDAYHLLTAIYNKVKYFATFDHDFDAVFAAKKLRQFV